MSKQKKKQNTSKKNTSNKKQKSAKMQEPKEIANFMEMNVELMFYIIATTTITLTLAFCLTGYNILLLTIPLSIKAICIIMCVIFATYCSLYTVNLFKAKKKIDERKSYEMFNNMFPTLIALVAFILSALALFK